MSDQSPRGPSAEPSMASGPGGSPSGGRLGSMFGGRRARGQTNAASAGLKFDIGGLQQFKRELKSVRDEVTALRGSFRDMVRDTKDWTRELVKLNAELSKLRGARGANTFSGGTPGGMARFTGAGGASSGGLGSMMKTFMGGGAEAAAGTEAAGGAAAAGAMGGAAAAFPPAAIAMMVSQAVSGAISKGFDAMNNRFARGLSVGGATDMWLARTALSTGTSSVQQARGFARSMPLMGGAPEVAQAINMFATQGGVLGGPGLAGRIGAADVRSGQQLQGLLPGTTALEAASRVTALQGNVEGQRRGQLFFGQAAWMTPKTGNPRSAFEYYRGILKVLEARRVGRKKGQPYTREELEAARAPGSTLNYNLSLLGWDGQQISDFFDYAIGQAAYDPTGQKLFEGTPDQNRAIGRGDSVARNEQLNQTAEGKRDMNFYANQADSMIGQLGTDRAMIAISRSMDDKLGKIYDVLSNVPTGMKGRLGGVVNAALTGNPLGVVSNVLGAGLDLVSDVGDIGDNGLSQLNPDLRKRMGAMMAANPNLQVNSGFRDARTQKRLWDSGKANIAAPGKSRHGRGQAADVGPRSQLGWLNANAKKFGLDTGKNFGEPWHVQIAGSMIGDVGSESDAVAAFRESNAAANRNILEVMAARYYAAARGSGSTAPTGSGSPSGGVPSAAPAVTGSGRLSAEDVAKLAYQAGFRGDDLVKFVGIAGRESGYDTGAANDKGLDNSYGLWQINTQAGNLNNVTRILNELGYNVSEDRAAVKGLLVKPEVNAAVAKYFFDHSGYSPWKPPKSSDPSQDPMWHVDLTAARAAVQQSGVDMGDVGAGMGGSSNVYANMNQPMTFNANFQIIVNGNNGVDVNGLTRQIAAKLEPHVRRMQMTRR